MLLDDILEDFPCKIAHTQFVRAPKGEPFAVWVDDIECSGVDERPSSVRTHSVTIGFYEHIDDAEGTAASIELLLDSFGLAWSKQDRTWFNDEQLYQTVYTFEFRETRRLC